MEKEFGKNIHHKREWPSLFHYSAEIGSIPFLRNAKVININTVSSQGCNKIADAAIDKQFSNQA